MFAASASLCAGCASFFDTNTATGGKKVSFQEDMKAKNSIDEQMKAFMPPSTGSSSGYISQAKAIELGKELY